MYQFVNPLLKKGSTDDVVNFCDFIMRDTGAGPVAGVIAYGFETEHSAYAVGHKYDAMGRTILRYLYPAADADIARTGMMNILSRIPRWWRSKPSSEAKPIVFDEYGAGIVLRHDAPDPWIRKYPRRAWWWIKRTWRTAMNRAWAVALAIFAILGACAAAVYLLEYFTR